MNIPDLLADLADAWNRHAEIAILITGAVAILLGTFVAVRWYRSGVDYQRTGTLAIGVATAFTAEGMWEVARESLNLDIPVALVLFAMFEIVMVNQGQTARAKLKDRKFGEARRHMAFVWLIAVGSGIIASLNSTNKVEFVLRLTAPFVAAGIWWTSLTAAGVVRSPDPISWRITPRRVLVFLRLADPGERDVIEVDQARQVAKVAALSYRLFRGIDDPKAAAKTDKKLSDLLLTADEEVVRRAATQVWQAIAGRRLTVPPAATVEALRGSGTAGAEWEMNFVPGFRNPWVDGVGTPGGTPAGTPGSTSAAPLHPSGGNGSGTLNSTPVNGDGAPSRNPAGTPGDTPRSTPAEPRPAKGAAPQPTSGGTGADTPDEYPADAVLLPVLLDPLRVPRDPDGTVPVKRAMRVLSIGRPRAIRMLTTHGLLPGTGAGTPDAKGVDTPAAEGSDDDQERHPEPLNPINGTPQPELIGAL